MYLIITVEGNIGAGKSTLINKLKMYWERVYNLHNVEVYAFKEPVKHWKSSGLLGKYYSNMRSAAFQFQVNALLDFHNIHKQCLKKFKESKCENVIIIRERSVHTTYEVFCNMLYESKVLDATEKEVLFKLYNNCLDEYKDCGIQYAQLFVMLNTSPDECLFNIKKRNRKEETSIDKNYLTRLEEYLKKFSYNTMKGSFDRLYYELVDYVKIYLSYKTSNVQNTNGHQNEIKTLPNAAISANSSGLANSHNYDDNDNGTTTGYFIRPNTTTYADQKPYAKYEIGLPFADDYKNSKINNSHAPTTQQYRANADYRYENTNNDLGSGAYYV